MYIGLRTGHASDLLYRPCVRSIRLSDSFYNIFPTCPHPWCSYGPRSAFKGRAATSPAGAPVFGVAREGVHDAGLVFHTAAEAVWAALEPAMLGRIAERVRLLVRGVRRSGRLGRRCNVKAARRRACSN